MCTPARFPAGLSPGKLFIRFLQKSSGKAAGSLLQWNQLLKCGRRSFHVGSAPGQHHPGPRRDSEALFFLRTPANSRSIAAARLRAFCPLEPAVFPFSPNVVVVVQIGLFLLPLDTLAVLEQLPLRAAFVTAGLIVGTGTLTGKHDRHLSHKT